MNRRANPCNLAVPPGDVIAAYLDDLRRRLSGRMPQSECYTIIEEAAEHLERLEEDARMAGHDRRASAEHAVAAFGEIDHVADTFVQGWLAGTTAGRISRWFGFSRTVTFAWFAMAETACVLFVLLRIYFPSTQALPIVASPASIRAFLPTPLPTPDFTGVYLALLTAEIGLPLLAGAMVGRSIPSGAGLWSVRGVLTMIVYSLALGLATLPSREFLNLAIWQAMFWLPAGALAAHVSSFCARRRSRTPAREHRPVS